MPPTAGVLASISSILDPIAKPIADILAAIYHVVPNYGVAILAISVAWMIIIAPLTLKSTRSMLAMSKLQPQLQRLREQHRNDRQAFAQAQMELMREHNVSPFGSCLPLLLQMPVFFALFYVIDGLSHTVNGQAAPRYLSHTSRMYQDIVAAHGHLNAFGLDLAKNALSTHSSFATATPYFALVLIMMVTQYVQTAQMMSRNPASQNNPQAKLMKFLPLVFGLFCIRFPAGVVLYYAMSNVCRIVQQDLMYRFDPKVKALVTQEVNEVEAKTHDIDEQRGRGRSAAKGAGEPAGAPPATGRGRFRDLLAAAAEQQTQARAAKAAEAERPRGRTGKAAGGKAAGGAAAKGAGQGAGSGAPRRAGATGKAAGGRAGAGAKGAQAGEKGGEARAGGTTPADTPANGRDTGTGGGAGRTTPGAAPGGRTGAGRPGARAASGRAAEGGHRTNRKRRGR